MASRKLMRDMFVSVNPTFRAILAQQVVPGRNGTNLRLVRADACMGIRPFTILNEFSNKVDRTKQRTGQLYKHVDGVCTGAEAMEKKVHANVKEKMSAPKEEVKQNIGAGKQEASGSSSECSSAKNQQEQQSGYVNSAEKVFHEVKSVVIPSKQSKWNSKWEALMEKMRRHPLFKRITGVSEPVATKSHKFEKEDSCERLETNYPDTRVVYDYDCIPDTLLHVTVIKNSPDAISFQELYRRDPSFYIHGFIAKARRLIRPILDAYFKGDTEVLKKYCSKELIERCKAEHQAFDSQGIICDSKILHVSDGEAWETKLMEDNPLLILEFQIRQAYCARDKLGSIIGEKDTTHPVHFTWAMQPEKEGAYPEWKLKDIQDEEAYREQKVKRDAEARQRRDLQDEEAYRELKGCDVSIKELDSLLSILSEKKRKLEQEEATYYER